MLGRLLQFGTGSGAAAQPQPQANSSRPVSSLESVQEDTHTRNLLFPDPQLLLQNRNDQVFPLSTTPLTPSALGNPNAFDSTEDLDLDVRDVRVLIMQDTLGPMNASLLFDSHPAPVPPQAAQRQPASGQESRRTPGTSRKGSIGQPSRPLTIHPDAPSGRQGAFDRRGSTHTRSYSSFETESQKQAREYREELSTFASCAFGNSELMSYKGTSTKVHVVPVGPQVAEQPPPSIIGDGRTSLGRSSARSSKLSQSFTSQNISPNAAPIVSNSIGKKKILITRLFPVNLTKDDISSTTTTTPQNRFSDENSSYPFPTGLEDTKKKGPPKQRRTPMYAVVFVVQLPNSRSASTVATPKSLFRESGSYTEQDVFSSSYSSARPPFWGLAGSGQYGEATDSSFSIDVEDRIDSLTQHWDIVIRTLTHLQLSIAATLRTMLKQTDVSSPDPFPLPFAGIAPPRGQAMPGRRSGELPRPKPSKGTTKLVMLPVDSLSGDVNIAAKVNIARRRIVTGLKASRVVTGQARWGIWRDEAIWTSKWTKLLGQDKFLHTLLTGFLSTHIDWLQALGPPSIRKRLVSNRRQMREREDLSLPARTIIVSEDKMAARRLIFLLSAFLPRTQQQLGERAHRSSTNASISGLASSPPAFVVPVLREESLRRKINRRTNRRTSHSRTASQSARSSTVSGQFAQLSNDQSHERRFSDASSIRPTSLAISTSELSSRKSSAATTATVMPETTMAHFSSVQRVDSHRRPRPESSGGLATDDLKRSLKRGESSGHGSNPSTDSRSQGSRWGSVISGLWSPRRRGSTSISSAGPSELRSPTRPEPPRRDKLSRMVEEATIMDEEQDQALRRSSNAGTSEARDVTTPREQTGKPRPSFSQPERTPDPSGAFDSPVKTSVNEEDGVIDVDFPFPDYIASFESAISSPSSSGYLSTPGLTGGLDSFENLKRTTADGEPPLNAAGWLTAFHPDFSLQAIPPQDDLIDEIKAALRAEPTPTGLTLLEDDNTERWVDVGSVVIADTTTSTVRRISYRRLVKPTEPSERQGGSKAHATPQPSAQYTPSAVPTEVQLEDEFSDETITKPDGSLSEALEKVIGFRLEGGDDYSPLSRSVARGDADSDHTLLESMPEGANLQPNPSEMPRVQCKTTILSALEDIIRDVVDRSDQPRGSSASVGGRYEESSLQQAVRNWLIALEG